LETEDPWLERNLDWKIKHRLLERYRQRAGCTLDKLRQWDFFINKMKDLRLERDLLNLQRRRADVDVNEYLMSKLSQADAIQLRRNLKYLDIDLREYSRIHRIYHSIITLDLRYHDIRRKTGLYHQLAAKELVDHWGGDDFAARVEEAVHRPPSNTRARVRGRFIEWMYKNNLDGGARWDSVYIYGRQLKKIDLPSPFKSSYKKVSDLMKNYSG
jgi:hypothetical protein